MILGGGAGGVTAALQLSKSGWQQHFESITLYQQGWRLGGKGACGRGPDLRIEEHGLHIWFGFYENSFRLLDRCHRELDELAAKGEPRWDLPFTSVERSFSAVNEIAVADHDGCSWKLWLADFFDESDDRPWYDRHAGIPDEWTVPFYLQRCLQLAADLAWSLVHSDPDLAVISGGATAARAGVADLDDAIDVVLALLDGDIQTLLGATADLVDGLAEETFDQPLVLAALGVVVRVLDACVDFLRRNQDALVRASDSVRRAYYVVDLMLAIARGIIEDGVIAADSFDVVDDVDLRDWLLAHGAAQESVNCALIRAIVYDLGFAYEGGDPQRPACAAGTALRGLLRTFFTCRGSLMWRMNAGMGDVVFLPFFELLHKRGVDVRFFHRVEALRVAGGSVEEIEIDIQADVPVATTPRAYVTPATTGPLGGGTAAQSLAWPSDPTAILGAPTVPAGEDPAVSAEIFESWYADRAETRVATTHLRRGAADGFDLVVFGLPISCVPNVAGDLIANSPRWKRAVDYLRTVPTEAMQLWLDRPAPQLAGVDPGIVLSGFVEPFDSWADMCQLVSQEKVAGSATIAYFCNVLVDAQAPPRGQAQGWLRQRKELVAAHAQRFLSRDIAALWPGAVDPITGEFQWQRLVAPPYLRANVEPSERYVLSVPGSSEHRIPPDDTGFANLYAVGDWTACGLNAGCVEAAVMSGMVAANAIQAGYGDPADVDRILGFEGL